MTAKSIPFLFHLLVLTPAAIAPLHAEVKPPPPFSDGAVLQRDQELPIWGAANDSEKVPVPVAVHYDRGTFDGNFFNAENLSASLFRTDVD